MKHERSPIIGGGAELALPLDNEWRLMNEALERLGLTEEKSQPRKPGRLVVALDLTGSREPTLKQARVATAGMFEAIKSVGAIEVQLAYYRGANECRSTRWHDNPARLSETMQKLACETGQTQIARILNLVLAEKQPVAGVVFVGDHCEEEPSGLISLATKLRRRSTPLFVFHECADNNQPSLNAKPVFKAMAEASGGVYVEFKPDSGAVLREVLSSVAAFSAAGIEGVNQIEAPRTPEARQLRRQLMLGPGTDNGEKGN